MTPSQVMRLIMLSHQSKQPLMLTGTPGIGKSDIVRQSAQALGVQLYDLRATLLEPVDVAGVPVTSKDQSGQFATDWAIPKWLPKSGEGILFLDELTSASQQVQIALYSLVLDRRINDYVLPEGWSVMAAGNNITDRAGTNAMPSPLANRFIHAQVETSLSDWLDWAAKNKVVKEVRAFISFKADLLNKFDPAQKAFPTPRTWEMTSNVCRSGINDDDLLPFITGIVGEGAAIEFTGFLKVYTDLPTLQDIITNPTQARVPNGAAAKYAIATTVAQAIDKANIDKLYAYMSRFSGEYQTLMVKESVRIDPTIVNSQTYIDWALANASKIL